MNKEIYIELKDDEWDYTYIDEERWVARAIVFDEDKNFYFLRLNRDDEFGKGEFIETSGGGVEKDEPLDVAIKRELNEEMGAEVEIIAKIGVVSDYYNLINRHNINNYFLCKVISFGDTNQTEEEKDYFHLRTIKLSYDEALKEYEKCRKYKLGRLIYNREIEILKRAKEIIDKNEMQ